MSGKKSFFKMISKGVLDRLGPPRVTRDPRAEDLAVPGAVPSHLHTIASDPGAVDLYAAAEGRQK